MACKGCSKKLPPGAPAQRRWCSEACRVQTHRRNQGQHTIARNHDRICIVCSDPFTASRAVSRVCGVVCQTVLTSNTPTEWQCPDCSVVVVRSPTNRRCGSRCKRCRTNRNRDSDRRHSNKRRIALTGDYTTAEIARRDGERCHLCRRKVNMNLPGSDEMGPTIDHLIPISCGGVDERSNVSLAHRTCNLKRGVRGEVQLLLMG